jgi:hypothetical protein
MLNPLSLTAHASEYVPVSALAFVAKNRAEITLNNLFGRDLECKHALSFVAINHKGNSSLVKAQSSLTALRAGAKAALVIDGRPELLRLRKETGDASYVLLGLDEKEMVTSCRELQNPCAEGPSCGSSESGWPATTSCPKGFILVPANNTPGFGGVHYPHGSNGDFCVAKYEMKNPRDDGLPAYRLRREDHGEVPQAKPEQRPWINIHLYEARQACARMSTLHFKVSLINNAEWQTIARNI